MPTALRSAHRLAHRLLTVERVDPAEDLLVADILRLGDIDEDVEVIRHDRIRKNDHTAKLLDPAQQLNRPRLLVVIEKKRLMRTTHSASLREQPNGWWI